jgi:hypothetical protein
MEIETKILPEHWGCALINGDETGLNDADQKALDAFVDDMIEKYGRCWAVSCDDEPSFMRYHDAEPYGVRACDCLEFTFDVSKGD